jgi:hypothetical protein
MAELNQIFLELPLNECADMICSVGTEMVVLAEGDMGQGKTSMLDMIHARFPKHIPILFDSTTKDIGDLLLPKIKEITDSDVVHFAVNEEFGVHLDTPVIICVDEIGKASGGVKKGLTRFILERKIGSYSLHPDSIVYATTNKAGEGVGDQFDAHVLDRMVTVRIRKHKSMEWIDHAITIDVEPSILGFAKEFPQIFQPYEEVVTPEDNPYIFHPQAQRTAFVTGRSLVMASKLLKKRDEFSKQALRCGLAGAIGEAAARDLMAFIQLADQLPTIEDIKSSPETALVPTNNSAVCMVVFRALAVIERGWVDEWVTYMNRLNKEAQGLFANGVRADNYHKRDLLTKNKKFTDWCHENHYLYS